MTQRKLKLVKHKNGRTKQMRETGTKQPQVSRLTHPQSRMPRHIPRSTNPKALVLTPDEVTEAARFKAMTAARAARQAMLRRIMAEVAALDETSPAA
jgi:hypothetical protein